MEYVSIGVMNSRYGTITDETGNFSLDVNNVSPQSTVRISMIGYESQTYTLEEFRHIDKSFELALKPTRLEGVTVKPFGKEWKIGTTGYTKIGNWCGWGGSRFGKGHEIGTTMDLGDSPVYIKSLHIRLHRQAYDTSLYRLHIRTIEGETPKDELLSNNIILQISDESGWVDIDLSEHNIVLGGKVALTLEWLKVYGINENRAMKINEKVTSEYVLFNTKRKKGNIFTRWGVEADWKCGNRGSPSIYITVAH